MELPLQMTFRDIPRTIAIESAIRKRSARLDRLFKRIMACRVIVERSHSHHYKGNWYHCRIDLTVPRGEVVVGRDRSAQGGHQDVYVAIRDAFNALERRARRLMERRRGQIKASAGPPHGRIVKLSPTDGFGFLETEDGQMVYFHENSVLNGGFEHLQVGDEVRFTPEPGDNGLQASTVTRVGKESHNFYSSTGPY